MPLTIKKAVPLQVSTESQLIERMSSIAEELEDLVQISKGRPTELVRNRNRVADPNMPAAIFREIVLDNLLRGRLRASVYHIGRDLGKACTATTKEEIAAAGKAAGMGRAEFSRFDLDHLSFTVRDTLSSRGVSGVPRPVCFLEAGFFAGVLEGARRAKTQIIEVKCRAAGADACYFRLASDPRTNETEFSEENLKLLTSLAAHSITAIENALLFEKTKHQISIDSLTQAFNHRFFQTGLQTECHRAQRYGNPLTLFMLDIDDFKKLNDRYGHPKGDKLLRAVADVLRKSIRDVDIVARYGGDEFAIILPQTDAKGAEVVARRIRARIGAGSRVLPGTVPVSLSIGAVTFPAKKKTFVPAQMIQIADQALLRAKRRGKNNVVFVVAK